MKKIIFKQLTIENFGGIANLEINFQQSHEICGPTGCGKTTILKAIKFVLGYDDKLAIPAKNGHPFKGVGTEVELNVAVDGTEYHFTRTINQKTAVDKMTQEDIFDGNVFGYYEWHNPEPLKAKQYQSLICETFGVTKEQLDLLVNFNEFTTMNWVDRRDFLLRTANADELMQDLLQENQNEFIALGTSIGKSDLKLLKDLESEEKKLAAEIDSTKEKINYLENFKLRIENSDDNIDFTAPEGHIGAETTSLDKIFKDEIMGLKRGILEATMKIGQITTKKETLQNYVFAKNQRVLPIINKIFNELEFNLWETKTTVAERKYSNCCQTVLSKTGSQYDSASCGEKILIDFIVAVTLRKLFDIDFPIIIDERQSITLPLECEYQKIEILTQKAQNFECDRIDEKFKNVEVW